MTNILSNIKLYDVTLRDGLQSLNKSMTLDEKKQLLHSIIRNSPSKEIEIGSLVSSKILPQMDNSLELYKYAELLFPQHIFFMLIPNKKKLELALNHNVKNFAFITSTSDKFQLKNVNKTLIETREELKEMINMLDSRIHKTKLYISCVYECPYIGKQSVCHVVDIVNDYLNYNIQNICIADTCGSLTYDFFSQLLILINKPLMFKLSLHLHNPDNKDIESIIKHSLENNINTFDVSYLHIGGCPLLLNNIENTKNLTYAFFDKQFTK